MALVIAVVPTSAQQDDPRLTRIRADMPEEVAQQVEARISEAQADGLPVEPLLDKAVEGIAKRVPAPRIADAVDRLAGELGRAHALLGNDMDPAPTDVAAVADAMRRGVPEPAIQRIAERAGPDEPLALAIHTMGDLMDRGVPVEQAVGVLEAWRGRGAQRGELRDLPGAVERLIRQGVLPGRAAAAVANAMRGGPPGGGQGPGGGRGPEMGTKGGPPFPPGIDPPSERGHKKTDPGKGKGPPGGG